MSRYYVTRTLVSTAFGCLFGFAVSAWWVGVLAGVIVLAFFVWAPRSGRYTVNPQSGATALRRDEYAQAVNATAARNAFVATLLSVGGVAIYFGTVAEDDVPVAVVTAVLAVGLFTYFVSDLWLRRP
jgi:hypothetical protein